MLIDCHRFRIDLCGMLPERAPVPFGAGKAKTNPPKFSSRFGGLGGTVEIFAPLNNIV